MKADLLKYWPDQESVAACLKIDAESASEAVFLAVHQPVTFERYEIGSQQGAATRCNEQDLLDAFLRPHLSDGRVIIPLVGDAGLGKSHIVRWIHSKLNQMPDADKRVVIRIPKGTSLKGVLGLLLEKLVEPEYEPFRAKLREAQDELNADEASGLLCEMLAHTLIENAQAATALLQSDPSDRDTRKIQAYGDPKIMPTLLRNQRLRELHFIKDTEQEAGPIRRLVEQLTVSRDSSEEDDRKHGFVPDDLLFPSIPLGELGQAEHKALNMFERADRRIECVEVLNTALVDAKERLLGIDPTVTELFDAVRRKLLEQNKELIVLVEDFAVLSGIQKQLLQVVIKEAVRDGQQILCTMRSVLAYTSGYLKTATVLTRAGTEYRISDAEGDDDQILGRIERLVGAYLNAARTGQHDLDAAYKASSTGDKERRNDWLPYFDADISSESRKTLEAFNTTSDGYPLFPFNRKAIRELSYEGCVRAEKLIFNPRYIIQNVLNRVLLNRGAFESDDFPPGEFTNPHRQLASRITQVVRPKVTPDDYEKWLRFLRYWGGNPSTPEEISFSSRTAVAFGLDPFALLSPVGVDANYPLEKSASTSASAVVNRVIEPQPAKVPAVHIPDRNPIEAKWEVDLEAWRNNQRLGQNEAKELRKMLARAANRLINWDWNLIKPLENAAGYFQHVYIPLAPGNEQYSEGSDSAMFAVCTDEERANADTSARIVSALMAAIRYHLVHSESWDYPNAEADLALYSAFMEPLAQNARDYVSARFFRTPAQFDPSTAIMQGLLVGARALGAVESIKDRDYVALLDSLFATRQSETEGQPSYQSSYSTDPWDVFTKTLAGIRNRDLDAGSWTNHLLSLVGARQGGGATVYAIDSSRLKAAMDAATRTWEFDERVPERGNNDYLQFRKIYMELRKLGTAADKEAGVYRIWLAAMKDWLGEEVDKELLVTRLKETVDRAKNAGFASNLEPNSLMKMIDDFRNIRFKAALDGASRLKDVAPRGLLLSIVGAGHREAIAASYALQARTSTFFDEVEIRIASQSSALGQDPKQDALDALKLELDQLEVTLKEVCTG